MSQDFSEEINLLADQIDELKRSSSGEYIPISFAAPFPMSMCLPRDMVFKLLSVQQVASAPPPPPSPPAAPLKDDRPALISSLVDRMIGEDGDDTDRLNRRMQATHEDFQKSMEAINNMPDNAFELSNAKSAKSSSGSVHGSVRSSGKGSVQGSVRSLGKGSIKEIVSSESEYESEDEHSEEENPKVSQEFLKIMESIKNEPDPDEDVIRSLVGKSNEKDELLDKVTKDLKDWKLMHAKNTGNFEKYEVDPVYSRYKKSEVSSIMDRLLEEAHARTRSVSDPEKKRIATEEEFEKLRQEWYDGQLKKNEAEAAKSETFLKERGLL